MKFSLAILAVLAVAGSFRASAVPLHKHHISSRGLQEDLNDFLALVPVDEITDIFYEYLSDDEDFGEALDYLLSDEFKRLVIDIEGMQEVKNFLNFLQDAGLDAYGAINKLNQLLGINEISTRIIFGATRITGGLPGFIKDVKAVLPLDKIEKLYEEKLKTSKDFAKLVDRLKSKEAQELVNKLMANPKLLDLIKRAEAKGVNVQEILDLVTSILGIKFPSINRLFYVTRGLKEDFKDFLALVPIEKITDIFYDYLSDDEDFGETIDYILSEEFRLLVIDIEGMQEINNFLKFLQDSGLDAYGAINKLNEFLGIDKTYPRIYFGATKISGGLPGFIKDVKAVLPLDKIEKLYEEKLKTSNDFAKLVDRLKSEEAQELVNKLMANPKLLDLIKRAEAKGVNVQEILDLITSILGIKFPSLKPISLLKEPEIHEILEEIWARTPIDDILDLVVQYFIEDEQFKRVYKFMLGGEFKEILVDIEDMGELSDLLEYLYSLNLDAYSLVNDFNALIGLEKRLPSSRSIKKITGGMKGLIHDIFEILPVDELNDYFQKMQKESAKFREFVHRLENHELQNLVYALNKDNGFNLLLNKLEALGVDFEKITDVITAIIGIKFPQRPDH